MRKNIEDANKALQDNKIEEAAKLFSQEVKADPNNALARQGLGQCFYKLGEYDLSLEENIEALRLDDNLSKPHIHIAYINWQQGNITKAESHIREAINRDPNSSIGFTALGKILLELGRIQESVSALENSIAINSDDWVSHVHMAEAYLQAARKQDAIRELNIAYSLHKSFETAYYLIGGLITSNKIWVFPVILFILVTILFVPLYLSIPLLINVNSG